MLAKLFPNTVLWFHIFPLYKLMFLKHISFLRQMLLTTFIVVVVVFIYLYAGNVTQSVFTRKKITNFLSNCENISAVF